VTLDVAAARAALGLGPRPTWEEVRSAYRARIQQAHPDRAGGTTEAAAALNGAYAALLQARRDGRLDAPSPSPTHRVADPVAEPAEPAEVLDGDTIHLHLPPDEAFLRLLDAAHHVGDVTYVDRSCAIFEALVTVAGEGTCSLVVTLQGRADGTDAFCTLEAIEHVASPPVRHVTEALVAAL
jgi:hypothetical protein